MNAAERGRGAQGLLLRSRFSSRSGQRHQPTWPRAPVPLPCLLDIPLHYEQLLLRVSI